MVTHCSLFSDTVSISGCVASGGGMVGEWRFGYVWESSVCFLLSRNLKGLREATEHVSLDSRCPDRGSISNADQSVVT